MKPKRKFQVACGAALMLPLSGCISVSSPDKPIEINLNVTIQQEVLVRLQRDVEQLIQENPEAFPQPQPPQPQPPRQQ
jgi:lipoprotein NlpI